MTYQDSYFKGLAPDRGDKPKRYEKSDDLVRGLRMAVHPSGKKSWVLRFWFGGKKQALSLGKYPEVSLADARDAARKARATVTTGRNPAKEKIEARQKADADAAAEFEKVYDLYERLHINRKLKASTAVETKRVFKATIKPALAKKRLPNITSDDIQSLLDSIVEAGSPVAANRVRATLRHFFNFARKRKKVAVSPMDDIDLPSKEVPRDRALTDAEIRWLWQVCEADKSRVLDKEESRTAASGAIPQLLLLTGARLDEVCSMSDLEISQQESLWKIPGSRTKNGRAHEIHITTLAANILKSVPRVVNPAKFVFCTNGQTSFSGFSRMKKRLDREMLKLARAEQPDVVIPHWTVHDLRRTCATGMARLGIEPHIIEWALNHRSGSRNGLVSVYQTHGYVAERKMAFERWSEHVLGIAERRPQNVIAIDRRRAR